MCRRDAGCLQGSGRKKILTELASDKIAFQVACFLSYAAVLILMGIIVLPDRI